MATPVTRVGGGCLGTIDEHFKVAMTMRIESHPIVLWTL